MAREAVVADYPILSEQVKEEMQDEVKISEEIENPKTEDSSPTAAMPLAESEDKIEAKPIETPAVEEFKETVKEEELKAEELVTSAAHLAEAEDKVEDKKIETFVVEEEKKTVDKEKPMAAVEPTSDEKPKYEDSSCPPIVLDESEGKVEDEPPVTDVKHANEEVHVSAAEVVPSVESELKAEVKNIDPCVVEVKIADEPLVLEEKITTETHVVEESKIAAESPVVEKNIVVLPFIVEKKLVQTPLVEKEDSVEKVVVEEKIATETPVVEAEKIATDTALLEGKIVVLPSVVEEKIVGTPIVEEEKNKTETPIVEEVKNAIESPLVLEEKEIIMPTLAEEVKSTTEPAVIEEVKHTTEPPLLEVKNSDDTPVVVASVEDKSIECTARPHTPDVMEPAAKIVESQLVTETSKLQEAEKQKVASVEEKPIEQPKTDKVVESSIETVDKKEQAADLLVEETTGKASTETTSLVEAALVKVEAENIAKDVKTDSAQPKTKEDGEVVKSISASAAAENILEGVITIKDAKLVTENEKEDKKSETVSPVKTNSNGAMEAKTLEKPNETEQEKPEVKAQGENIVQTDETKEPDDKLTSRDLPNEVVAIKSTQKQSKTILSKVKNTLVKAKKVITGKSANTKTPSSEPKGEVKV